MLGLILGGHPLVHTFHELHFFDKEYSHSHSTEPLSIGRAKKLLKVLLANETQKTLVLRGRKDNKVYTGPLLETMLSDSLYALEIYRRFIAATLKENDKQFACEHTPAYIFHIPEILDQFPEAKIICIVRDPRGVLLSRKYFWKRQFKKYGSIQNREVFRSWVHYHPISSSLLFRSVAKIVLAYESDPNVYMVRYEDILACPEKKIIDICRFAKIDYQSQMLNISKMGSSVAEDQPHEKGIDAARSSAWQKGGLNSAEIFFAQKINHEVMKQLQYYPINMFPNLFLVLVYFISLPMKMILSLLIHVREFRNIYDVVIRRLR